MKNILAGISLFSMMLIAVSCTTQTEDYTRAGSGNGESQTPAPSGELYGDPNTATPGVNQNQNQQQIQAQANQQQQAQAQQQAQQNAVAQVKSIGDEKTAHFICPNACAGSGADNAGNCPTCGSGYTHNTESPWHEANQQQTTPDQGQTQATTNQVTTQQQSPEVILGDEKTSHYICPDACAGSGSPAPGKCGTCDKTYVHNSESPAHQAEIQRQGR